MKKVLYWADFDFKIDYSRRLIKKLKELGSDKYEFTQLKEIWKLAHDDFDISVYDIIILQSTDVTKFSADDEQIEKINRTLEEFVDEGKKLIVSHDVIYRRTRNELLQEIFNYRIKHFARVKEVEYFKTSICKNRRAFYSLNDEFKLSDGEVCWGDVNNLDDKIVFFETSVTDPSNSLRKISVPTVFGKKYNGGSLIWFNTGDMFEEPPKAISNLEINFINLIMECLDLDLYALDDVCYNSDAILSHLKRCDTERPFVFISYCDKNADRVYEICMMFDFLGVNYYIDKINITSTLIGSGGWKDEVEKTLNSENCIAAFIFLSEEFFDSENCVFEIEQIESLKERIKPVVLSISLSINKILKIVDGWNAATDYRKFSLFKELLSIKMKSNSTELEINQLVFNCHRDLSQFFDRQFLNTVATVCGLDLRETENVDYINSLIKRCKEIN